MKKLWLFIFVLVATYSNVAAQNLNVSGKVISEDDGMPIPGVNVAVEGMSIGTITDFDGNYSIKVPGNATDLVFSYVGFVTQQVQIQGRTEVDITMQTNIQELSEVVITGYGDRDKTSFTGSAGIVGGEQIEDRPFANVEQALQGNVAGVQLTASSGTPGSVQDIRIRGISSITAGNAPLYVIDGVPVVSGTNQSSGALYGNLSATAALSANDIESITVLKDASATALYGARGANGVVVITTKKGNLANQYLRFQVKLDELIGRLTDQKC